MLFGQVSLIIATVFLPAVAQDTGSIEGRVISSTAHTGIEGVMVTVGSQQAVTDPSGAFRVTNLPPGNYGVSFKAAGFFDGAMKFRLDSVMQAGRLDTELIPHSSIFGRVLDSEGNPMAGVAVEITEAVRGTGTTWTISGAVTDNEGRYRVDAMKPGTYLAMARPNPTCLDSPANHPQRGFLVPSPQAMPGEQRACVRTYYPSVADRSQAGTLVLRGGDQQAADIRILTVPVYAIRGVIFDDGGRPTNGTVSLVPSEAMENPGAQTGLEAQTQARDGVFNLPDVPAGAWQVIAEADRAGTKLRGVAPALLNHDDVDVRVHLTAPFAIQVLVEPRGLGESPTVELYPTDAPPNGAAFSKATPSGKLEIPGVYAGRYSVEVFTTSPHYYLDSVLLGEQTVLGKEVTLTEGSPPIRVVFKQDTAGVHGYVEKCGAASILLFPEDEELWNYRFIRRGSCDSSGHFEIGGLRPGKYYALALDHIDPTGLDNLSTLRHLVTIAVEVQASSGSLTYIELETVAWPD